MSCEEKVIIINTMEEVYDIQFTDEQIDVLLGDLSVEIERQRGKTFVIACKAILESIVAKEPIKIKIHVKSKAEVKNMKDYIRVLAKKMKLEYKCKEDIVTILNGTIFISSVNNSGLVCVFPCKYLLIDDVTNTRFLIDRIGDETIEIEVINKNGTK